MFFTVGKNVWKPTSQAEIFEILSLVKGANFAQKLLEANIPALLAGNSVSQT